MKIDKKRILEILLSTSHWILFCMLLYAVVEILVFIVKGSILAYTLSARIMFFENAAVAQSLPKVFTNFTISTIIILICLFAFFFLRIAKNQFNKIYYPDKIYYPNKSKIILKPIYSFGGTIYYFEKKDYDEHYPRLLEAIHYEDFYK